MLFKSPKIGGQFASLHPDLRAVLRALDVWAFDGGMESITITDAIRSADEQERLYTQHYLEKRYAPEDAARLARKRFTWHFASCAADFRHTVRPYTDEERRKIWLWLREHCPSPEWELLEHNLGFGLHFHVARRDFLWRRKWEQKGRTT
jgi:hypothetical protein